MKEVDAEEPANTANQQKEERPESITESERPEDQESQEKVENPESIK